MIKNRQQIGEYVINCDTHIGAGCFSAVYSANDLNNNREVALKICKSDATEDEINRFKGENEILHRLSPHERIIEPYSNVLVENNFYCYAMELAYCNLTNYLNINYNLSFNEKLELFKKICDGISHSHIKNVVHRDLWWNNVLLLDEDGKKLKLCDFGRAKDFSVNKDLYSPQKQIIGGINFIYPPENIFRIWEKAELEKYIFSDIYALGIMLFYIFSNIPSIYHQVIEMKILEFLTNKGITRADLLSKNIDERRKLYDEWQKGFEIDLLMNHLKISVLDQTKEENLNKIITKLCHPGYENRYKSVDLLLEDLKNV